MPHIEIERKFLLSRLPEIPRGAEVLQIEQGYLAPPPPEFTQHSAHSTQHLPSQYSALSTQHFTSGRLRRTIYPDGRVLCQHAIKTGIGLIRHEVETEITPEDFAQHWPCTRGRRVRKTRYRVRGRDAFVWEIDEFADIDLILAEVELPAPDSIAEMPDWLKCCVAKEVTDDPAYTNASIARRIGQP